MATILSRYILREILRTWFAVTGVLLAISLTNQLATVLTRAAQQGFPREVVLELVWLGAVSSLPVLLSIGVLLAIVLALGRLYQDSELTAAVSCGASPWQLHLPLALFAVLLAAVVAVLTFVAAPQAAAQVDELRVRALRSGEYAPLAPGQFRSFGADGAVMYAESVAADGSLQKVFVKRVRDQHYEIAVAARARHEVSADGKLHVVTLYDGERYEGVPGSNEFRIVRFATNVIPVRVNSRIDARSRLESLPSAGLLEADSGERHAEFHWRLATPIMLCVLAMLAVPLARLRPRQGRYARVWLAVVLYFTYFGLASAAKVWLARGVTPPPLALWWVHGLVIALTLGVIFAPSGWRRWRHLRLQRRTSPA